MKNQDQPNSDKYAIDELRVLIQHTEDQTRQHARLVKISRKLARNLMQ